MRAEQLPLWPAGTGAAPAMDWSNLDHLIAVYEQIERRYLAGRPRRSDAALARRIARAADRLLYVNLGLAAADLAEALARG